MNCLLFDFGGTLDSDGQTWLERFYLIYKEAGVNVPRERFDRAFYDSDDSLPSRVSLKGRSLEETVLLQVEHALQALAPQRLDLASAITRRFVADCRIHFQRNRPVLQRLARRFSLGVVSNFYGNLNDILRLEGLAELFGAVADSGALGTLKPAPAIFLHALEKLGSSAEHAVMIGDSIPRDMRGAESLKMRHVFLSQAADPCCAQAIRLRAFTELEAMLPS